MAYALVEDVAASWETYHGFAADLERSRPEGLMLHAAGRTDEGVRIIEVWESEEAWRRYAEVFERAPKERFGGATRYLRELRPAHLVIAGRTLESELRMTKGAVSSTSSPGS